MKKPTGPAKIDVFDVPGSGIAALLFNFDFDDEAVKPEHRAWLIEHADPSLQATDKRVFLRGIASQAGDRNYNLDLSKRRVQAVRKLPDRGGSNRSADRHHLYR
jgi:outer membrane protein OmpA-like peptidoglycan-associated protein